MKALAGMMAAAAMAGPAMAQSEIAIAGPQGALRGAWQAAASPAAPVVLIVPGSGPTDRDGNGAGGLRAATYRLLAEGLAGEGIASVRIDKRGMFSSAAAVADANRVTMDDYAQDVRAWVEAIRRRSGGACVWVLGHSEGALAALAAARDMDGACGLVLAAAPGRPLGRVLEEQLRANPANAPLLENALAVLRELEAGRAVPADGIDARLLPLFAPAVQGFLISALALDPAALLAQYGKRGKPVLIVQGQRDLQVGEQDARRLQAADARAELLLAPHANHVLKAVAGDAGDNLAAYADPARPLDPGIVPAVAAFIRNQAAR